MIHRSIHTLIFLFTLSLAWGGFATILAAPQNVPPQLHALASRAAAKTAWPPLLRYAQSQKSPEAKGLAYLALGYRELQAGMNDAALSHLRQAAATKFSLADIASYHAALAAADTHQPVVVVQCLTGFDREFPQSTLREQALGLYARALVDSQQAQAAFEVLTTNSNVRQKPELALILADALRATARPVDAAQAYEDIYYSFPSSQQAGTAGRLLDELRKELGDRFPQVSEPIQTARADKLFQKASYAAALADYETLLGRNPSSPFAPRWVIGRARCLTRLQRIPEALDALQKTMPQDATMDAERLSGLVDIYARQDDPESLDLIVQQLAKLYAASNAYAVALDRAGNYFVRKSNWPRAAGYYQPLAQRFPKSDLGLEANWRVAWAAYLQKDYPRARAGFEAHLKDYPDSWHCAAALYWLGRMAEDHGAGGAARKLYEAISARYGQSYYSALSLNRLAKMAESRAGFDSAQAGDWADVSEVAGKIPALDAPTFKPCGAPEPDADLDRFATLQSLSLDDLAEDYLRDILAKDPDNPQLFLALARGEALNSQHSRAMFDTIRAVGDYPDFQFTQLPKEIWDLLYPNAYWSLVRSQAKARGLDPYLVMGLIRQESAFNPGAVSVANARGLMQILPETAARRRSRRRVAARRLLEPVYNVRMGTGILRELSGDYSGNMEQMMAAYHAGRSRVDAWRAANSFRDSAEFLETIPIPSTRVYVEHVIRDAAVYRKLLTGTARFAPCGKVRGQASVVDRHWPRLPDKRCG